MKISLTRETTTPVRANKTDAGIDFFVPAATEQFIEDLYEANPTVSILRPDLSEADIVQATGIVIAPHKAILIPAGVRVIVPEGFGLIAKNKSGVSTKKQLVVGACVVDAGYEGEVHIHLINTSDKPQIINFGDKIVQFVLTQLGESDIEVIEPEAYDALTGSDRGEGGFGSSGTTSETEIVEETTETKGND